MTVVLFDFDGTIADTFDAVLRIADRLAQEFDFKPVTLDEVHQLQQLSAREAIRKVGISPLRLPFLLRRFRIELNQEIGQLKPIPGIPEALKALKHQGHQLGIVTSNSRQNVRTFLEAQGLQSLFDFVASEATLFGKGRAIRLVLQRNHLSSAAAIYVGDEARDIEAARKIGMRVIAVSWGFNVKAALEAQHPDYLVHEPWELVKVLEP